MPNKKIGGLYRKKYMKSAGKISKFTIRVKTPLRQELDLLERFSL